MLFLHIALARSAAEMDRLAPLWEQLLQLQEHSIFQRFAWNRLAAEVFRDRLEPHVIAVESDAGAAILPAAIDWRERRIELLGDALFDYRDVLHAGDPEVLRVAWQKLAELNLPFSTTALDGTPINDRWQDFPLQPFVKAPGVDRDLLDERQFRAAHARLGRRSRRLHKRGVSLRIHRGSDTGLVRWIYARKADQLAGAADNVFCAARRREFMVASCAMRESQCEIFTLETEEGGIIASLVTFRDGDVRRFYTIDFDHDWADYSPGVILVFEATAHTLGQGLSCDYMTGEQPYKMRMANSVRALYRIEVSAAELQEATSPVVSAAA